MRWRVFIRETQNGFFSETFTNYGTRQEVDQAVKRAKKKRLDVKVMDTETWTVENLTVGQ